jgi:hypothetical protein
MNFFHTMKHTKEIMYSGNPTQFSHKDSKFAFPNIMETL